MTHDAKLETVRKLLKLAEDPGATAAEAEAFTAKATLIMATYGIDAALVAESRTQHDDIVDHVFTLDAPYGRDKAMFVCHVAAAMRCKPVIVGDTEPGARVHVFGLETDVRCVQILVASLLLQAAREFVTVPIPPGEHVAAFRRSWWTGFSQAVYVRLREADSTARDAAQAERDDEERSVALVLADREQEIESVMHERYSGGLRPAPSRRLKGGGLVDGYASGERADLGTTSNLTLG